MKKPIGTGLYTQKLGRRCVVLENPLYFERDSTGKALPYLESIAITFVPDKQSEFMLFLQGKLDLSTIRHLIKTNYLPSEGKSFHEKYKDKINLQKGPYPIPNTSFYLDSSSRYTILVDQRGYKHLPIVRNTFLSWKYCLKGNGVALH